MKLSSFQIKNFKSIVDTGKCCFSEIDNISILVGQNESGKSSVLEALDFFANGPSNNFEKLEKRQSSNFTEVKCSFILSEKDISLLDNMYSEDGSIKDFFNKNKEIVFIRRYEKGASGDIFIEEDALIKLEKTFDVDSKNQTENQIVENENNKDVEIKEDQQEAIISQSVENITSENNVQKKEESDIEKISSALTKSLIDMIPLFSLYNSFNDLLPSEIELSKLKTSSAVKDFENVFDVNIESILNITDPRERLIKLKEIQDKATDDFNSFWTQKIDKTTGTNKYKLIIDPIDSEPKKVFFMMEGEDEIPLYLEQKSMGFRWFSAFHLRLRSLMQEILKVERDVIILIDEPGQNLHETAQRDVKKILNETAEKNIQIIYSTHNPNLIGDIDTNEIEYTRIKIVANHSKNGTRLYNITQFIDGKDGGGSVDAISPIKRAMGLNVQNFFLEENKFNVVVEGITDYYYFVALRELLNKDKRIHFIPLCGVNNIKSMIGLLIGWGVNYRAVFDDDKMGGRYVYNELKKYYFENDDILTHEHVLKIKGCDGIEDIFMPIDFKKYIYNHTKNGATKNSFAAKEDANKELIAREFLEKVRNSEDATSIKFSQKSLDKIEEIFKWIYDKFDIDSK